MNKIEVREKLKRIIREMLLADLESGREIPQTISRYILESYGWTSVEKSNPRDNLQNFIVRLQKWIEDAHLLLDRSKESDELDYDLQDGLEKYLVAEGKYLEVTSELTKLLQEAIQHKDVHAHYFKEKCKAQESSIEVLGGKCLFLKLQFLLKLYGEENALCGHLALQLKLKKELQDLKKKYNELVEYNKMYDEIKGDQNFCELFQAYKELRIIEERTQIIGQI